MPTYAEGFIVSQGTKIHYLAKNLDPVNRISLLFVPGVMMPAWIWQKQLDHFSKDFAVVAIDPRSQGDSEQSTEGHYAYSMAQDIKAVVDGLGLQQLVIVGWSLAVSQAVNYAAHFSSEKLIGLVLIDGLCGIDPSVPFYRTTVDYWTQLQVGRPSKTREFVRVIFKQPQKEAYFEKLTEAALRTPTNTVMALMENYILQDFRPLLPGIKIPALIMTIEGPRLGYMQKLKELLPCSRLEVVASAGHAIFVDQPEEFNRLLDHFIMDLKKPKGSVNA